jgi:hypothetical protein
MTKITHIVETITGARLAHNGQPERAGRVVSRHRSLEAAQKSADRHNSNRMSPPVMVFEVEA